MVKRERQALILKEVNIHNKVLHSDLSEKLSVSADTVRRDIQELADADKLIRVRGGALSRSFQVYSYEENDIYAHQEKTIIATKALTLLQDDMVVLISGGTTNLEVARILPPELKATFFTVSLPTAMQLVEHPNSETIFIGGRLSNNAKISVGAEVVSTLMSIRPDLCLLGTNSIDLKEGVTDADWEVVNIKKVMIEVSHRVAALTISEKLNSTQKMKICSLNSVDYLITELDPGHDLLTPYRNSGLDVL